jgi:hypothetical protein
MKNSILNIKDLKRILGNFTCVKINGIDVSFVEVMKRMDYMILGDDDGGEHCIADFFMKI